MLVWAAPEMTGIVWSPSACLDREYAVDANSAASVGKPAGDSQEVGIAAGVGYGANGARNAWIAPAGRLPDIPADFSADSSFDSSDSSIESASAFSPYRPMRPPCGTRAPPDWLHIAPLADRHRARAIS